MSNYIEYNKERWNRVSRKGIRFSIPISHEDFEKARHQPLSVSLAIGKTVPQAWFDRAAGKRILGLACGGGQQGPVFAAKGYDVTIMDFSEEQLAKDRMVAQREGLDITTVEADMTQPFPFDDGSFDIIFCPVSNCYIESLDNLWRECYRVLAYGGLLMAGFLSPWIYIYDADEVWDQPDKTLEMKYALPFNARLLEKEGRLVINPEYGYEFSHTLEDQIRGQLKQGFAMIDFYESKDQRNRLSQFNSDYISSLCVKPKP